MTASSIAQRVVYMSPRGVRYSLCNLYTKVKSFRGMLRTSVGVHFILEHRMIDKRQLDDWFRPRVTICPTSSVILVLGFEVQPQEVTPIPDAFPQQWGFGDDRVLGGMDPGLLGPLSSEIDH